MEACRRRLLAPSEGDVRHPGFRFRGLFGSRTRWGKAVPKPVLVARVAGIGRRLEKETGSPDGGLQQRIFSAV